MFRPSLNRHCSTGDSLPMSKFSYLMEEGETRISFAFTNTYCPEIVENFKCFLQGAGFTEETILNAFQYCIEEYSPLPKDKP